MHPLGASTTAKLMTQKCFVISPIGDPLSETRKRADGFLNEVIRPIAIECGYEVERADDDKSPGIVTEGIVNKIIDADLVIADLHGHNPNVMYELAIRHATDKPLIQMIEIGEAIPFDIGGLNTIFYDPSVNGLSKWREDLRASIKSVANGAKGANPVTRAGLMRTLKIGSGSEQVALNSILEEMQSLRREIRVPRSITSYASIASGESRLLVTPDQYMYSAITEFLMTTSILRGRKFLVQVEDGIAQVSLLPKNLSGPAQTLKYEFKHEPETALSTEIDRVKEKLLKDLEK